MSNFSTLINFFLFIKEGKLTYSPISLGIFFFVFQFCIITVPFMPLKMSGTDLLESKAFSTEAKKILDSLITHQDPDISAGLLRKHIGSCRAEALKYFSSDKYREYMKKAQQNPDR